MKRQKHPTILTLNQKQHTFITTEQTQKHHSFINVEMKNQQHIFVYKETAHFHQGKIDIQLAPYINDETNRKIALQLIMKLQHFTLINDKSE